MKDTSAALITATAAICAAVVALVGAIVGARLQKSRERQHWLRDQRLRYSVDFITATRRLLNEYRRCGETGMDQAERADLRASMRNARSAIELLCTPITVSAAKEVTELLYLTNPGETAEHKEATEAAFHEVVDALRKNLDI